MYARLRVKKKFFSKHDLFALQSRQSINHLLEDFGNKFLGFALLQGVVKLEPILTRPSSLSTSAKLEILKYELKKKQT